MPQRVENLPKDLSHIYILRLLTFIEGEMLGAVINKGNQKLFFNFGASIAKLSDGLSDFKHQAIQNRRTLWDQ